MKGRLLFFLLLFYPFHADVFARAGGEISYKYIGNKKFEVTFKAYRDCREVSMQNFNFALLCVSSNTTISLNAKLVSIKDLSTVCASAGIKCSPANTQVSSKYPIFEEHTYFYTLDFNGNETAFKNCCVLKIGMGRCCRSNLISTGAGAGIDFWVTSMLDLCKAPTNSSPVFSSTANLVNAINQGMYKSFNASDILDFDSLSYSFTDPLESWTGKTPWNKGYDSKNPFSCYWPSGYDKSKGPRPDASPPIGIYLDPETGDLVATPTDTFVTVLAISVKEWRKDSSGKYSQIGEVVRDMVLAVKIFPSNYNPLLNGPYRYDVCVGKEICFTVTSDDKQFIPPPPGKANPPDTVSITWSNNIKGATFTIADPKARLQRAKFCWTPDESDASNLPYYFSVDAKDNSCPVNAVSSKTYSVRVKSIAKTKTQLSRFSPDKIAIESQPIKSYQGTHNYYWYLTDSISKGINNVNSAYFTNRKLASSLRQFDTLVIRKNGKYLLYHSLNIYNYCAESYVDTIVVRGMMEVSLSNKTDTTLCKNKVARFIAGVVNGTKPFVYTWKTRKQTLTDTLGFFDQAFDSQDTIYLTVTDSNGNSNSTELYAYPEGPQILKLQDKSVCNGVFIKVKSLTKDTLNWAWIKNNNVLSNSDSVEISQSGVYIIRAQSKQGCISYDTVNYNLLAVLDLFKSPHTYCQDKNELNQTEFFSTGINIDSMLSFQWILIESLRNDKGVINKLNDLLNDADTSPRYNYHIKFGQNLVDLKSSIRDSLVFSLKVKDRNNCYSLDTLTIALIKNPSIRLISRSVFLCHYDSIDLSKELVTDGKPEWTGVDKAGYEKWPATGIISKGFLPTAYFQNGSGKYFVKLTSIFDKCTSIDSLQLVVSPAPVPAIAYAFSNDSIKFTDNSLNSLTRKWYLDNVFVSSNRELGLTKIEADNKPIRLELNNMYCSRDTTFSLNIMGLKNIGNDFVKIYPNPTNNYLTIEQLNTFAGGAFEIYNLMGKLLMKGDLLQKETTLNISSFVNGVYFLKVQSEKMTGAFQFIKLE